MLIRKGMGTRCLALHDSVTHVVVGDAAHSLDDKWRKVLATKRVGLRVVPHRWLLRCCREARLVPTRDFEYTQHPLKPAPAVPPGIGDTDDDTFRGLSFVLDAPALELGEGRVAGSVARRGANVVEARDVAGANAVVYVVTNHGSTTSDALCTMLPAGTVVQRVSEAWVLACIAEKQWVPPESHPFIFTPQLWPLQPFPPEAKPEDMKVSISIYEGPERAGITQLLKAMGVKCTSKLKKRNTHLICREAEGEKFARAKGWGVTIVRAEWLYECAEHGWSLGSEAKWAVEPQPPRGEVVTMEAEEGSTGLGERQAAGSAHSSPGPQDSPPERALEGDRAQEPQFPLPPPPRQDVHAFKAAWKKRPAERWKPNTGGTVAKVSRFGLLQDSRRHGGTGGCQNDDEEGQSDDEEGGCCESQVVMYS